MTLPFVTVGVIVRNEAKHIGETLKHLVRITYPSDKFEIVVVDGNSTDGTRDIARKILGKQHKVVNEKDYGFYGHCFARNLVVKLSDKRAKYIAYTDADCTVERDWLSKLVAGMEKNGKGKDIAGIGGPRLVHPKDKDLARAINYFMTSGAGSGWSAAFLSKQIKYTDSIANYNALYKKKLIQKHPYDNTLIISDDSELNFRLRLLGFRFLYDASIAVYHHSEDTFKEFMKHMFGYGENISRVIRKHKRIPRWYALIPSVFLAVMTLGLIAIAFIPFLRLPYVAVLGLYVLFIIGSAVKSTIAKRSMLGMYGLLLMPLQHVFYGLGVFHGLFLNKHMVDWRKKWKYR